MADGRGRGGVAAGCVIASESAMMAGCVLTWADGMDEPGAVIVSGFASCGDETSGVASGVFAGTDRYRHTVSPMR